MQMRDFRLDNHVAIITGAGRGIGAGIAMAYAQAGADVVLVARTRQQLDTVATRIRAAGRTAITVAGDVRDLTQAPIIVEQAAAELGRLDVEVNNAGGAEPRALLDTTGAELDAAFHLNVTAAFELAKLQRAAQISTTDGILFHQAVADRVGLHVTDLRCLNLLAQAGPLTAGELGQQLGLGATGAVTRMVDRLEGAGYVRREANPGDRRRVIIRPVPERLATIAPHYQGMASAWTDLLASYSDEQLHLFLDLFDRMHQMSQQQIASLHHEMPSTDAASS